MRQGMSKSGQIFSLVAKIEAAGGLVPPQEKWLRDIERISGEMQLEIRNWELGRDALQKETKG